MACQSDNGRTEINEHYGGRLPGAGPHLPDRARLRSVLFAITDADYPSGALLHCFELARSLQVELHVARVLPQRHFVSFARNLGPIRATQQVERCLSAARDTQSWCDDVLPEQLSANQLRIFVGGFVEEVSRRAADIDAALIVLAPSTGRLGTRATRLARDSMRPVLVLRTADWRRPLLAATALGGEQEHRVLQEAAQLGKQLSAPVVAVHNVNVGSITSMPHAPLPIAPPIAPALEHRQALLKGTVDQLGHQMRTVVTNEVDPVDAILEQARFHRAQVIVLGTRQRAWFERFVAPSIAVEVVNRAQYSVLVTPLATPELSS